MARPTASASFTGIALTLILMCIQVAAATAGALLVAALSLLMPAAYRIRGVSANKGFAVGCVVAGLAHGVTGLLCLATPYCLSSTA